MEVALAWRSWLFFLPNMSCMRGLWGKNSKTPKASALWGPTSPGKRRTGTWKASMTSLILWHSKRSRKLCKCHSFYAACLCACRMYHDFRSFFWSHMFNGKNERWHKWKNPVLGFPWISIFPVCFGDLPFHCPWNLKPLCCNCTHISHPFSDLSCGSSILTVLSTFTGKPGCHQTLRCLRLSMASDTHLRRCFAKPK